MNIFKTKGFLGLIACGAFALGGCTDNFDSLNTDPNNPANVSTYSLLYAAERGIMDNTRDEWIAGRTTQLFAQQLAQKAYTTESRYQLRPSTANNYYSTLFRHLTNLEDIIKIAEDEKLSPLYSADSGLPENQIQVARILKTYTFQFMTDTWGPIPYNSYGNDNADFQALKLEEGIKKPKFVSQERIYLDMLKELKEASETMDVSKTAFDKYDKIYNGDPVKWKKLANSLRLRIAVRILDIKPAEAKKHIDEAIESGIFTSNEDNARYYYETSNLKAAPWYKYTVIDNRTDFSISNVLVDIMKGEKGPFENLNDPRLDKFAQTNGNGEFKGVPYGVPTNVDGFTDGTSLLSESITKDPEYAEVLMEYAEVEFLLARYNNYDDTHYKNGIRASMEKWGVDGTKIANYLASVPTLSSASSPEEKSRRLAVQRYIGAFMQPEEAWSVYRKTGYPELIKKGDKIFEDEIFSPIEPNDIASAPSRLIYPDRESSSNSVHYNEAVQMLGGGGDKLDTKLWWMTK